MGKGKVTKVLGKVEHGFNTLKQNKGSISSATRLASNPKKANISSIASLASSLAFNDKEKDVAQIEKEENFVPDAIEDNSQAFANSKKIISVNVTDPEDKFFEETLEKLHEAADKDAMTSPAAAMLALGILSECAQETVRYCAEQETKREEIRAQRDCVITKINAVSGLLKEYLDKTFDERSAVFAKQFDALDNAMNADNTEALGMVLNSINNLVAQSPFKNLADINMIQQNLDEKTEWDI